MAALSKRPIRNEACKHCNSFNTSRCGCSGHRSPVQPTVPVKSAHFTAGSHQLMAQMMQFSLSVRCFVLIILHVSSTSCSTFLLYSSSLFFFFFNASHGCLPAGCMLCSLYLGVFCCSSSLASAFPCRCMKWQVGESCLTGGKSGLCCGL